jgi:hypothetical protein
MVSEGRSCRRGGVGVEVEGSDGGSRCFSAPVDWIGTRFLVGVGGTQ